MVIRPEQDEAGRHPDWTDSGGGRSAPRRLRAAAGIERIVFVSNEAARSTLVDGATGRIEGTRDGAEAARHAGLARRDLLRRGANANRIEAWDVRTKRLLRPTLGPDPERFAISPDGGTAYIANEDNAAVSFLDIAIGRITREVQVGPEPEGMGVSPDGRLVVATAEASSTRPFHRRGDRASCSTASLVGSRPRDVLFLDRGRTHLGVVGAARHDHRVRCRDPPHRPRHRSRFRPSPIAQQVQSVEMRRDPRRRRVFVAMGRATGSPRSTRRRCRCVRCLPTGHRTWGIGLSPDERRLYAASGLSGTLTIVDLETNTVAETVQLGGKPWGAWRRRDESGGPALAALSCSARACQASGC